MYFPMVQKERTIMNDQTNQATKVFSLGGLLEDSAAAKHAPPNLLYTPIFHIHTAG